MSSQERIKCSFPKDDFFNDKTQPVDGFEYPEVGDSVVVLKDFELPDLGCTVLSPGTRGAVRELRMPGSFKENPGYIGCCVLFDAAARPGALSESVPYPAGIVIPWDLISDPENFRFEKS